MAVNITYNSNSVYAKTPINSNYLGIWDAPTVELTGDEMTVIISREHTNRPDLLSHKLYGNPRLWWIFKMMNPDKLNDPIWDFKEGVSIIVPKKANVSQFLS